MIIINNVTLIKFPLCFMHNIYNSCAGEERHKVIIFNYRYYIYNFPIIYGEICVQAFFNSGSRYKYLLLGEVI